MSDPTSARRWAATAALVAGGGVVAVLSLFSQTGGDPPSEADAPPPAPALVATTVPGTTSTQSAPTTALPAPIPTATTAAPVVLPPEGPLFGAEIGLALLFDNGGDAVVVVDPDRRTRGRVVVTGQRGGDPPYRLTLVDGHLVVGWGSPYAVDVETLDSVQLGQATIYVPAVEPDRVWLVDNPWGVGATVWQADLSGNQLTPPRVVDVAGFPAIGIPGGLALETEDGIALWDAATGTVTKRLGTGASYVADAGGARLAWCSGECTSLQITDFAAGTTVTASAGDLSSATFAFGGRSSRFSPNGTLLAAIDGSGIVIVDTASGAISAVGSLPAGALAAYLAWSPDGDHVFASTFSMGDRVTTVLHHDVVAGRTDVATLPFGGTLTFEVVEARTAKSLLGAAGVVPVGF